METQRTSGLTMGCSHQLWWRVDGLIAGRSGRPSGLVGAVGGVGDSDHCAFAVGRLGSSTSVGR